MELTGEAWAAIGIAVSTIATAVSAVGVARINATKQDVGAAHREASAANEAAVKAADYARPVGNGYADESRAAWKRIQGQQAAQMAELKHLHHRQTETNAWLMRHLSDHAKNDITGGQPASGGETPPDPSEP